MEVRVLMDTTTIIIIIGLGLYSYNNQLWRNFIALILLCLHRLPGICATRQYMVAVVVAPNPNS
jgi:hypothetical protein